MFSVHHNVAHVDVISFEVGNGHEAVNEGVCFELTRVIPCIVVLSCRCCHASMYKTLN